MSELTPAQVAILKIVSSFNGQHGPNSIEVEMKALPGIPESEWMPIRDQIEALEDLGLIRPEVTEAGLSRYRMTERGKKLVGGAG